MRRISSRKLTFFLFLGLAFLLAASAAFWALGRRAPPIGVEVGQTAPDFSLPDLSGNEVRLSSFRGKAVLLYFWQSTCPDCRKALPELLALRSQFPQGKLVLVTVNLDYYEEDLQSYLDALGEIDFLVLRGSYAASMRIVDLFEVPYVPHVILLDRRGIIRFRGTYPNFPKIEDVKPWL